MKANAIRSFIDHGRKDDGLRRRFVYISKVFLENKIERNDWLDGMG
jgi:hypothetical protein